MENKFKVCSFNIRYDNGNDGLNNWKNRKTLVFDWIKNNDLDIIGFQEVLPHIKKDLINLLNDHIIVGTERDKDLKNESNIIAFKNNRFELINSETFWLSDTPYIRGSIGKYNTVLPRICTYVTLFDKINNKYLRIFNTHLDHITEKARLDNIKPILSQIKKLDKNISCPIIIMGDFNDIPNSSVLNEILLNSPLKIKDVSDISNNEINYTFHNFNSEKNFCKIDYILTSDNINCEKLYLGTLNENGIFLSDHFPVVAILSF